MESRNGKPRPDGVAQSWRPTSGGRTVYDLLEGGFTRHNGGGAMPRRNEIGSQKIAHAAGFTPGKDPT